MGFGVARRDPEDAADDEGDPEGVPSSEAAVDRVRYAMGHEVVVSARAADALTRSR